jgi:hypothetical protein
MITRRDFVKSASLAAAAPLSLAQAPAPQRAPAVMRTKFESPAAAGSRSGSMPASVSVVSGMKKNATAAPCSTVGTRMWKRSVCGVNDARSHST